MKMKNLLLILHCILLSACTPKFIVEVDSLCTPTAKEKTSYTLVPGNKDCSKLDLQYIEFETYTNRALQNIGFHHASEDEPAEVLITLYFGISDPESHEYIYSVPVYGQTGTTASTTYCNGWTNTTYTPNYGIVGSNTHVDISVVFKSYLTLVATNETRTLWQTNITHVGETGDLRILFPIMLAAAKDHIATDTGKIIQIKLKEKDERVLDIKGISKI